MASASARLLGVVVAALDCFGSALLTAQAPRLKVGGEIEPPIRIRHVAPVYPKEAIDQKIGGTVHLEIVIATEGSVLQLKVVQSVHELLDAAATKAVGQWKYLPTKVNGQPVELIMIVEVTFKVPT